MDRISRSNDISKHLWAAQIMNIISFLITFIYIYYTKESIVMSIILFAFKVFYTGLVFYYMHQENLLSFPSFGNEDEEP